MKVKSEFTIIERAIQTIDGFSAVDERIRQQTILRGQSRSTFENYIRQIARICLHFGRLPEAITQEEINEYLTGLAQPVSGASGIAYRRITLQSVVQPGHGCSQRPDSPPGGDDDPQRGLRLERCPTVRELPIQLAGSLCIGPVQYKR